MNQLTAYQNEIRNLFLAKIRETPSAVVFATERVAASVLCLRLVPPSPHQCPLTIIVEEDFSDLELGTRTHIDTDKWPVDFIEQIMGAVIRGDVKEIIWSHKQHTLKTELFVKMNGRVNRYAWASWGVLLKLFGVGTRQEIQYQAYHP